jgi:hypothetical protein
MRLGVFGLVLSILASGTRGERPKAPELLPDNTLALIRVADVPELITKFKNTSGGKMSQDPQLKPLFEHLYGKAVEAFALIEKEVGLPLPKILELPKGEICVGLIGPDVGKPVLVAWLDAGDQVDSAQKLLARATEVLDAQGLKKTEETVEGTKLTIYDLPDRDLGQLVFFEKDKTVVGFVGNNRQVVEHFLARWDGRPIKVEPPKEDEEASDWNFQGLRAGQFRNDGGSGVFPATGTGWIVRRGREHLHRYGVVRGSAPRPYSA